MRLLLITAVILALFGHPCAGRRTLPQIEPSASLILPVPKCFSTTGPINVENQQCLGISAEQLRPLNVSVQAWPTCGLSTTIPTEKIGSCPDAQAALDAHNKARARYGANPLLWSKTLAEYAQTVSNTCVFKHSNGQYGENLAIGTNMNCKRATDLWVAEESSWAPGSGFSSSTGHFTQVIWKDTTQVGCAVRNCGSQGYFVTCSYNPAGNVIGSFDSKVGRQGSSPECTAPPSGGGGTTPTPTTPSPKPSPRPPPARSPAVTPRPPTSPAGYCCQFCYRC